MKAVTNSSHYKVQGSTQGTKLKETIKATNEHCGTVNSAKNTPKQNKPTIFIHSSCNLPSSTWSLRRCNVITRPKKASPTHFTPFSTPPPPSGFGVTTDITGKRCASHSHNSSQRNASSVLIQLQAPNANPPSDGLTTQTSISKCSLDMPTLNHYALKYGFLFEGVMCSRN